MALDQVRRGRGRRLAGTVWSRADRHLLCEANKLFADHPLPITKFVGADSFWSIQRKRSFDGCCETISRF
jgi:hypothetical protein